MPSQSSLEFLPKIAICLMHFFYRIWVLFDEPSQKLGAVDFVGEHGLATGLEEGGSLGGWHRDKFGDTGAELVNRAGSGGFDAEA